MPLNLITTLFQDASNEYHISKSFWEESPEVVITLIFNIAVMVIVALAVIYLYILIVKYLRLRIKELKNK